MYLKYELYVKRVKLFCGNVLKIAKAYFIASLIRLFHAFKLGIVRSRFFIRILTKTPKKPNREYQSKTARLVKHLNSFFLYYTAKVVKNG
nr:MAG TPA: hypothetical protein [Caudoviricetes sp.]